MKCTFFHFQTEFYIERLWKAFHSQWYSGILDLCKNKHRGMGLFPRLVQQHGFGSESKIRIIESAKNIRKFWSKSGLLDLNFHIDIRVMSRFKCWL